MLKMTIPNPATRAPSWPEELNLVSITNHFEDLKRHLQLGVDDTRASECDTFFPEFESLRNKRIC